MFLLLPGAGHVEKSFWWDTTKIITLSPHKYAKSACTLNTESSTPLVERNARNPSQQSTKLAVQFSRVGDTHAALRGIGIMKVPHGPAGRNFDGDSCAPGDWASRHRWWTRQNGHLRHCHFFAASHGNEVDSADNLMASRILSSRVHSPQYIIHGHFSPTTSQFASDST